MDNRNVEVKLANSFHYEIENLSLEAQKLIRTQESGKYDTFSFVIAPAKVNWCGTCNGTGKRSVYDVQGYDIDRMMNTGDYEADMEFREDYFGGKTDTCCDVCEGTKIQNEVDYNSLNKLQDEIFEANWKCYREEAQDRAEEEAERRAGC